MPNPGPVFRFECLAASRRRTHFLGRAFFVAVLLAVLLFVVAQINQGAHRPFRLQEMANAGEKFYLAIIVTQLGMLFLVAPALAADAICLDKARGALLPLLATDLSSADIVLGKLGARLLPIGAFVICGLPVMAICFTMGGIYPEAVFGAYLISLGVALIGGTLALALSVWCTKPYEVLLGCYVFWIVYLLFYPTLEHFTSVPVNWAKLSHPVFLCVAPYVEPGSVALADFYYYFAGSVAVAAVLVGVAIFGVRKAALADGAKPARRRLRWWRLPARIALPGPSLDRNPVLWREWHRQMPSRWVRLVWRLFALIAGGFSLYFFGKVVLAPNQPHGELGAFINAFQVSIGLLLISVVSVTSLQDERVHGSLDALLASPLSTSQIFWGKWWGSFRIVILLSILPTLMASGTFLREIFEGPNAQRETLARAVLFVLMPPLMACYGAAFVSIGLALAIWIKKPGRAMTCSIVIYVVITVGLLLGPLLRISHEEGTAMGSSFMAAGWLTIDCMERRAPEHLGTMLAWSIAYGVAALLIAFFARYSFDRCLGRIPERRAGAGRAGYCRSSRDLPLASSPQSAAPTAESGHCVNVEPLESIHRSSESET
jgi:ABC-type transport system involved in multi-copper enzyme maturation permease subunit